MKAGKNINHTIIDICHSSLKRVGDSIYRSECPVCKIGMLLVYRNKDLELSEVDRCIFCGQLFRYTDINELRKGKWA